MIEGIEALIALERTGTVSEAAAQLRLTQSAVSKRIYALQDELGYLLIEPDGRRVQISSRGKIFLEKAKPLISELKSLTNLKYNDNITKLSIGLADSIGSSWGPALIKKISKLEPQIQFEIHVHRSVLVAENVKLGKYHLGLCTSLFNEPNAISETIYEEPLVIISSEFAQHTDRNKSFYTIEKGSATWYSIGEQIMKHPRFKEVTFEHLESFSAVLQMVKVGFGNGLVPLGIAESMGVPAKAIHSISPIIKREIKLFTRKSVYAQPSVAKLFQHIKNHVY